MRLFLLLLSLPLEGAGTKHVTRCPEESRPVRTVDPARPWACVLGDERYRDGIKCPSGSYSVTIADAYDPFKCALTGVMLRPPKGVCPPGHLPVPTADPDRAYECEEADTALAQGPSCPKGTRPVPTPGALSPFKCASGFAADPEPAATPDWKSRSEPKAGTGNACPKGTRRLRSENPFDPLQCVRDAPRKDAGSPLRFQSYAVRGEVSFDYPRRWHLTDAWKDETPSILVMYDIQRDGKPLSLSVTLQRESSPSYLAMASAVHREKDWHGAREEKGRKVAGREALLLTVPGESRSAFIPLSDGYLVLTYSAPSDLYPLFLPAYERLLDSFRIGPRLKG